MKVHLLPSIQKIKTFQSSYKKIIKHILKKDSFGTFTPIPYQKFDTIAEAKKFMALNFMNTEINVKDLKHLNIIINSICRLYNMTKGKIEFPAKIQVYKHKRSRYVGSYGNNTITLNTSYGNLPGIFAHELAHYNHEKTSLNYIKMGKKSELINTGVTDFSLIEKFYGNKELQRGIKKYVCTYALSSPAEFIACTFEALSRGRKIPLIIWKYYKEYDGPCADVLKHLFKD